MLLKRLLFCNQDVKIITFYSLLQLFCHNFFCLKKPASLREGRRFLCLSIKEIYLTSTLTVFEP